MKVFYGTERDYLLIAAAEALFHVAAHVALGHVFRVPYQQRSSLLTCVASSLMTAMYVTGLWKEGLGGDLAAPVQSAEIRYALAIFWGYQIGDICSWFVVDDGRAYSTSKRELVEATIHHSIFAIGAPIACGSTGILHMYTAALSCEIPTIFLNIRNILPSGTKEHSLATLVFGVSFLAVRLTLIAVTVYPFYNLAVDQSLGLALRSVIFGVYVVFSALSLYWCGRVIRMAIRKPATKGD